MWMHLDTNCRNKSALRTVFCHVVKSVWLSFKTFYLSTAVTALNFLGQTTVLITIIIPLWIQTCRNTLVQFPAVGLGTSLKPASYLQVLKVFTWRALAKFFCKTVFTVFTSPKARYLSLKSFTYLWYNIKMLLIPHIS